MWKAPIKSDLEYNVYNLKGDIGLGIVICNGLVNILTTRDCVIGCCGSITLEKDIPEEDFDCSVIESYRKNDEL